MKTLFTVLALYISSAYSAGVPVVKTALDQNLQWGTCPEIFPKGCAISVLQGDPKKPGADIYLKVPANYDIPAHSHTSPEHMTLVTGNLDVKYKDAEPMSLKPGSFAYGPAKHPHSAKCAGPEACVLFISFDQPIDALPYKGKL